MPRIAVLCASLVGGCFFSADYPSGSVACNDGICPDGLECRANVCLAPRMDAAVDMAPDMMIDARQAALVCADPGLVTAGTTVMGSTATRQSTISAMCGGFVMNGPDAVYKITVGAGVETPSGQVQKESKDVTVPAPIPGLYFSGRLPPKFYLQGNAQYVRIAIFSIDANMSDYRLQGVWLPTKHFGAGIAWSGNAFNVEGTDTSRLYGKIKYSVTGPSLFVTFTP